MMPRAERSQHNLGHVRTSRTPSRWTAPARHGFIASPPRLLIRGAHRPVERKRNTPGTEIRVRQSFIEACIEALRKVFLCPGHRPGVEARLLQEPPPFLPVGPGGTSAATSMPCVRRSALRLLVARHDCSKSTTCSTNLCFASDGEALAGFVPRLAACCLTNSARCRSSINTCHVIQLSSECDSRKLALTLKTGAECRRDCFLVVLAPDRPSRFPRSRGRGVGHAVHQCLDATSSLSVKPCQD